MKILVLNCGSSSLKYQLLNMKDEGGYDLLAKGLVERIGMDEGHLKHTPSNGQVFELTTGIPDHTKGINLVLQALTDKEHGVISNLEEIDAVGHRVLHGGHKFFESVLVNENVVKEIESIIDLGPLHLPANLMGISAVTANLPKVPQVAVFDTAFHQTMPEVNYIYALPYEYYEKYHIRRYGFHGTSHKFVSAEGAKFAGIDLNHSKIITCHLGNGSSVSAVLNGKCYDTSMGLTPLAGMIMGTRCGDIDPEIVCFIMEHEGLDAKQMSHLMEKKSGLLGVSGVSSDCRDCEQAAAAGNRRAQLALDMLAQHITKLVGAYAAEMNGVDLIIFTGGIGENNSVVRQQVCQSLSYMGLKFDEEANRCRGISKMLSASDSKVKVAVIPTNEELMIARDTMNIVKSK